MLSTQLANFLKKMISFGNAASPHSGLIPLKTAYKKRTELLRAIARKKNFSNLHSAAFVTVFTRNVVQAYKFRILQNTEIYAFSCYRFLRWLDWIFWGETSQV